MIKNKKGVEFNERNVLLLKQLTVGPTSPHNPFTHLTGTLTMWTFQYGETKTEYSVS